MMRNWQRDKVFSSFLLVGNFFYPVTVLTALAVGIVENYATHGILIGCNMHVYISTKSSHVLDYTWKEEGLLYKKYTYVIYISTEKICGWRRGVRDMRSVARNNTQSTNPSIILDARIFMEKWALPHSK